MIFRLKNIIWNITTSELWSSKKRKYSCLSFTTEELFWMIFLGLLITEWELKAECFINSPNLNWNASKLCNTVLTRLLLEVHLKTSRSFWRSLLLMAEVLLWMKEEQPTCVLVFTLDRRHCSLVAGTRSETQQIRHDGFFGNWHTIISRLRIQELEIGN